MLIPSPRIRPIAGLARALLCFAHSRPRQSDGARNTTIPLWEPRAAQIGLKIALEDVIRLGLEVAELDKVTVDEVMKACTETRSSEKDERG